MLTYVPRGWHDQMFFSIGALKLSEAMAVLQNCQSKEASTGFYVSKGK